MSKKFTVRHDGAWCARCRHSISIGDVAEVTSHNGKPAFVHDDRSSCVKRTSHYRRMKRRGRV